MARKRAEHAVNRRNFLTGMAVAGAVAPVQAKDAPAAAEPARPSALRPTAAKAKAETGTPGAPKHAGVSPASDSWSM